VHLVKRIDLSAEDGFKDFHRVDESLENMPIKQMSKLTQRMMQSIDYDNVAKRRRANFMQLHNVLCDSNHLSITLTDDAVPMVYPYMVAKESLRAKLIANKVFVARYWPNVLDWTKKGSVEYLLTEQIQPLPIDQRYGEEDMKKLIEII
jgi:hypothetical protein